MSSRFHLFAMLCACITLSISASGANQDWDSGGGADQNWATDTNWDGDIPNMAPASGDNATIANGGTAVHSAASGTNAVQRTSIGGGSTLNITGGKLSNTLSGNTVRNNVGDGSAGAVNQSGGTHVVAHMLRIGNGSGGNGTYNLSAGDLLVSRGGNGSVSSLSTSLDVGVSGGTGLFKISWGTLTTRVGVGIGANGTFHVEGSGSTNIAIGSIGDSDGFWEQDGLLKLEMDSYGVTPITVDYVDGAGGGSGDVAFTSGALLEMGFLGGLDTFGVWDIMSWDGALTDGGLAFAAGVDTNQWSFEFIDSTGSGDPDTLRVMSVVENNGTWIDAANADVSWTDAFRWSGGTVAYGPGKTAYFDTLNHLVAKTVDLPVDIEIGTIRYRDNGGVNRDMTISSDNGSRLVMDTTSGTPLIWARNRSIHVDVVIAGTDGLTLATEQTGHSVYLKQRNSYSGTTTVLDNAGYTGTIKTSYPGDFGDSDLVVLGNSGDTEVEVSIDHSNVLIPAAHLTLGSGAKMNLNYAGVLPGEADFADLFVSALTLGGAAQPEGVYSAATHPAYFTGTGEIVVQPVRNGFPLALNANTLVWPSQDANLYDIVEATDLVSNDWAVIETVDATAPTNVYGLGAFTNDAAFYKVEERPDYLPTVRAGVMTKLDSLISNNYLPDQNLTVGDIRHGQFHSSDNMRMSECTPVLVWCYMQPDSTHYQDPEVLNRAIWSIDHMCRAQGINGGFNEYHGWCGVPIRTNGKSSVVGFTLHGIGNAISLMASLPEMQPRLLEYMDPNGTGSNDTQRVVAWKSMLSQAMPFQFSGSGRGHAPNQDLCALMGVYAVNGAYAALDGGTLLKTQGQIDVLANEIYYGTPSAASARPNGQWFSPTGMLAEHGHEDYGYDGNYGVKVSFRYLGVLAPLDTTTATFLSTKYADALQYFFVTDETAPLGVFAENGIARRSTGDPLDPTIVAIGNAAGYHDSLDRLYDIMLPHFASAPAANMSFPSPHMFQIGVWGYCEWLDKIEDPVYTDYRLPAEQNVAWEFRDDTMKTLVTKPEGGVPTYYCEIWDTVDKARRHVTGQAAETIDTLNEFP